MSITFGMHSYILCSYGQAHVGNIEIVKLVPYTVTLWHVVHNVIFSLLVLVCLKMFDANDRLLPLKVPATKTAVFSRFNWELLLMFYICEFGIQSKNKGGM